MTVFLSYAHQDADLVAALRQDLEDMGQPVWIDKTLFGGQIWWDEILRQVRECHLFVLAISVHSLDSEACLAETEYAVAVNRPFLPVRLDDIDMTAAPERLRSTQHIDFKRNDAASAKALAKALNGIPHAVPLPDVLPPAPPTPQSYRDRYAPMLSPEPLAMDEQMNYFIRLTVDIDTANSVEALELLKALRDRDDLSWKVRQGIDRFLHDRNLDGGSPTEQVAPDPPDTAGVPATDPGPVPDRVDRVTHPDEADDNSRLKLILSIVTAVLLIVGVLILVLRPDDKKEAVQLPENSTCNMDNCSDTPIRFYLDGAGPPENIKVTLNDPYGVVVESAASPTEREDGKGLQWSWTANAIDPIGKYTVRFDGPGANPVEETFTVDATPEAFGVVQKATAALAAQRWEDAGAIDERIAKDFDQGGARLLETEYPPQNEKHWYPISNSGDPGPAGTAFVGGYISYDPGKDETTVYCELWLVDPQSGTMKSESLPRNKTQRKITDTRHVPLGEASSAVDSACTEAAES